MWLVLSFHPDPPPRDFGEVSLGAVLVRRVDPRSELLTPALDPRWAVTEAFVVAAGADAEAWERRLARELAEALAEDVGGQARELELSELPSPLPAAPGSEAEPEGAREPEAFAEWLAGITDDAGFIVDDEVRQSLWAHYELAEPRLRVAKARAKAVDLEALAELVRERFDAALPSEYLRLLTEVGALRLEVVDGETKSPLRDVLLPPKAITHYLTQGTWLSGVEGRQLVPFFRFGEDEFYALDLARAEPSVCGAYFTGDVEPAARSFSAWLRAWRRAAMVPDLMGADDMDAEVEEGSVFESEASFVRWWNGNAGWAREIAPD